MPPSPPTSPTPRARPWQRRLGLEASVEQLIVLAALFWTLSANRPFFNAALKGRDLGDVSAWGFAAALMLGVLALHVLLLALVAHRWWIKPLLALLTVASALAGYYMGAFGIYLDPSMLRNVLHTHPGEARELLSGEMALHLLLYAGLPLLLLWQVRVRPGAGWRGGGLGRRVGRAMAVRLGLLLLALALLLGAVMAVFQPLASLMRNHRELRYLITPANLVWSLGAVVAADAKGAAQPRQPIGLDVAPGPSWAGRQKPLVVLLVVGETARAANWGLNGYARQTTPELAALLQASAGGPTVMLNFPQVTACGTNTETSLPCMFAPIGRRDYDDGRIRGQQSLLHVAARAGVDVHWRDNQSGCKGVCDGLPGDTVSAQNAPGLCRDGNCLDEGLIADLDQRLQALTRPGPAGAGAAPPGTHLWVLHMLGNHGPAYHRRVPTAAPGFARFQPACSSDDLRLCTSEQIVNAYDNALLYTDHVLASAIAKLQARAGEIDTALVYVSDHGESLGERGLYLHGLPYAIAPDVQKQVPMVAWFSPGLASAIGLPAGCLKPTLQQAAARPLAHDHLFHTLLSLLDLRTALHAPDYDLLAPCRSAAAPGSPR